MVIRVRHLWNQTTREVQFYLTSLESDALILGKAIRLHWGIENGLHWTMDVTFNVREAALKEQMLVVFVPDMHHKTLAYSDGLLLML
jgi:predicted transposase YbfD/YdcC